MKVFFGLLVFPHLPQKDGFMPIIEACQDVEKHMMIKYSAKMLRETSWIIIGCKAVAHFVDYKGDTYYVEIVGVFDTFNVEITKKIQGFTLVY
jgi:hypothetical protein